MQFWLWIKTDETSIDDIISLLVLCDIPYNFVVQHQKNDETLTTTIKESSKFYFKRRFFFDVISSFIFWQFLFHKDKIFDEFHTYFY